MQIISSPVFQIALIIIYYPDLLSRISGFESS